MNPARLIWKNPVVIKEIRTRMRGSRAFWLISAHLLAITLVTSVVYLFITSTLFGAGNIETRRFSGKIIFGLLISLELIMISFTAPALTAGLISSERERYTYDLLQLTLLPAPAVVIGKFLSALVFLFLLLLTSIPLQGPAFMIGGIAPVEILVSIIILLVTAIAFCAVGIFFSSVFRRTLAATVTTYALSIMLVFGLPMLGLIAASIAASVWNFNINYLSPSTQSILAVLVMTGISITPLGSLIASEAVWLDQGAIGLFTLQIGPNKEMTLVSPWVIYVIFYILLSCALLWLSVRRFQRTEQ